MFKTGIIFSIIAVSPLLFAQSGNANRFRGMDRNGDGMITRDEWRGNQRAFERRDWNNDGVLSGDELGRGAGRRQSRAAARGPAGQLDRNASGAVEGNEWPYNRQVFHELDRNGDSVLTSDELNGLQQLALKDLDTNKDGKLTPNEWPGRFAEFRRLDANNDGRVTADEYFGRGGEFAREQRFREWDTNHNGVIDGPEWRSDNRLFHQLDRDMNSVVSLEEFVNTHARWVKDLDRNGDGVIARSEWRGTAQAFRDLDLNGDGVINSDEFFTRGDTADRQQRFTDLDANRDGVIEGNEWHGDASLFRRLDRNGDAVLQVDEFFSDQKEQGFADLDRNSDGFVSRQEWYGDQRRFDQLDLNRDGWLSQYELYSSR